jgi:UMF1 family MFS transporter
VFLFVLANIGVNGSFVFYDALLPHVARPDEVDRVSAAGYALGYLGGGTLLVFNLAWIQKPGWFGLPSGPGLTEWQATLPVRLSFLSVAIWWPVFAIPLFRRVSEPPVDARRASDPRSPVATALEQLGRTFRELRRYKQGSLMLLAFLIYNDGIGTIIRMATSYGKEMNLDSTVMIASIVIVQFVGIPFTFLFGWVASKVGAKRSILFSLGVYGGICVLGRFMSKSSHFVALAVLLGMVQGGSQSLSRSLFASMVPKDKTGEFFGFFAVVEKFAGIFGPMVFLAIIPVFGSSRNSILALIVFFLVGGVLLARVDVEQGRREALEDTD